MLARNCQRLQGVFVRSTILILLGLLSLASVTIDTAHSQTVATAPVITDDLDRDRWQLAGDLLPKGDDEFESAKELVVETICGGLEIESAPISG
jgi:hypothetical protein